MLRKLARRVLFLLVGLAVIGGILYAAGLRIVQYGGGGIQFAFTKSADQRAAEIEKHREAQRAQAPPPAAGAAGSCEPLRRPLRQPQRSRHQPLSRRRPIGRAFVDPIVTATTASSRCEPTGDGALTPLWKQPVGGGYASFVIADGRAFTIEQRGGRELAAAYDLATGRELWTSAWNARFQERGRRRSARDADLA